MLFLPKWLKLKWSHIFVSGPCRYHCHRKFISSSRLARGYWTQHDVLSPTFTEHPLKTTAGLPSHSWSSHILSALPEGSRLACLGLNFLLCKMGILPLTYSTVLFWGPNEALPRRGFVNAQELADVLNHSLYYSCICKDTVIPGFWKDFHGNQIIKAKSSVIRLPLKPASIHICETHSPTEVFICPSPRHLLWLC